MIHEIIQSHVRAIDGLQSIIPDIERLSDACVKALRDSRKLLLFGNGGSASDAQHFAAEIVGRFTGERRAFPAIALVNDGSIMTSVANDYSFDDIFARQVQAFAKEGDICIGISTSGNSRNVFRGLEEAKNSGCITAGLLGHDGGIIRPLCDLPVVAPGESTARIQECHGLIIHIICALVDRGVRS
ncbi:MAG TPA: SIS domain-containing protein [Spirochaetota bacterium]|nr:SIS domain-containing protein [Spirochaetota bacterium]